MNAYLHMVSYAFIEMKQESWALPACSKMNDIPIFCITLMPIKVFIKFLQAFQLGLRRTINFFISKLSFAILP